MELPWRMTSNCVGSDVGIGKTCCMDCTLVTLSVGPSLCSLEAIAEPIAAPMVPAVAGAPKDPTLGPAWVGKAGGIVFFFLLPHLHPHSEVPDASDARDSLL